MSHKVRDIVTLNAGSGSVIPGLSEISNTHCIHRKINYHEMRKKTKHGA